MDDWTHVEPPGPAGASDLAELALRAGDLWRWAGQPTEEVMRFLLGARRSVTGGGDALPAGTLARVLAGERLAWEAMEPFLVACLRCGRRTEEQVALALATWRTAWQAAVAGGEAPMSGGDPRVGQDSAGATVSFSAFPLAAAPSVDEAWLTSPSPPRQPRRLPLVFTAATGVVALVALSVAVAATHRHGGQVHAQAATASTTPRPSLVELPSVALPAVAPAVPVAPARTTASGATPSRRPVPSSAPTPTPGPASAPPPATVPTTGGRNSSPAPSPSPRSSPRPTTSRPAPQPPSVCTPGGCAAMAYFVAEGEHLYVCDKKPDGYGAVSAYTRTDVPGQNNVAWDRNGSGTCIDHNMNMPEGAKITFRVCLGDKNGRLFGCSAFITAVA